MPIDFVETGVAFFCVADGPGYVPKAITALASVRRFHPDAGYFILGRSADADTLALIAKYGMTFQPIDLSDTFRDCEFIDSNPGNWPSECFWWTYAYKTLSTLGYTHSCALDGDIICVNPIEFPAVFEENSPLSGVEKKNGRVNSGVLFFDHAQMEEAQFFEKIVDVYNTGKNCDHEVCEGYCREKGDQGLLWEIDRLHGVSTRRIENAYNHMLELKPESYRNKNPDAPISIAESKLLHILFKPWRRLEVPVDAPAVALEGYRMWWAFAEEIWPDAHERLAFFGAPDAQHG